MENSEKLIATPPHWGFEGNLFRSGQHLLERDGEQILAVCDDLHQRVEWQLDLDDPDLCSRITNEKETYDVWAESQLVSANYEGADARLRPGDRFQKRCWEYSVYCSSAGNLADYIFPFECLRGARVLDIGGSVKDSWRFVWHEDTAHVDQVDVSGSSQRLAYKKLEGMFSQVPELLTRFTFHTAPAENLPFANNSFDLVFSRATIHHTKRPIVFHEVARVLKPGGWFVMIEPRRPFITYWLMVLARQVRRADRGTDNPLQNFELKELDKILPIENIASTKYLQPYLEFCFSRLGVHLGERIFRVDELLSKLPVLNKLGHQVVVSSRKAK